MASSSAAEPSLSMEETRNWLEMPHDMMRMILQRLSAVEILISAQKVCTTWRMICKDPEIWKIIDIRDSWDADYDVDKLTKQAVHRSCGELVDINLERFGTDDLLDYISRCSSKLKRLCLMNCYDMTGSGLSHAVERLPHLETLHLFYTSINVEDIKVIGQSCPQLKSFKMNKRFRRPHIESDGDALAIANSMPALRHLQLFGNRITNDGLQAILHGCPQLESLDLRRCFNLHLGGKLGKVCMERIKDFKPPYDSTEDCGFNPLIDDYDEFADMISPGYSDVDDFSSDDSDEDYG